LKYLEVDEIKLNEMRCFKQGDMFFRKCGGISYAMHSGWRSELGTKPDLAWHDNLPRRPYLNLATADLVMSPPIYEKPPGLLHHKTVPPEPGIP
jgi:hypothetical protein